MRRRRRRRKNVLETPGGWSGQVTLSLVAHPVWKVWAQKQQTKQKHSSWPATSASSHPSEHFLCFFVLNSPSGMSPASPASHPMGAMSQVVCFLYNTAFLLFISEFFPAVLTFPAAGSRVARSHRGRPLGSELCQVPTLIVSSPRISWASYSSFARISNWKPCYILVKFSTEYARIYFSNR